MSTEHIIYMFVSFAWAAEWQCQHACGGCFPRCHSGSLVPMAPDEKSTEIVELENVFALVKHARVSRRPAAATTIIPQQITMASIERETRRDWESILLQRYCCNPESAMCLHGQPYMHQTFACSSSLPRLRNKASALGDDGIAPLMRSFMRFIHSFVMSALSD